MSKCFVYPPSLALPCKNSLDACFDITSIICIPNTFTWRQQNQTLGTHSPCAPPKTQTDQTAANPICLLRSDLFGRLTVLESKHNLTEVFVLFEQYNCVLISVVITAEGRSFTSEYRLKDRPLSSQIRTSAETTVSITLIVPSHK